MTFPDAAECKEQARKSSNQFSLFLIIFPMEILILDEAKEVAKKVLKDKTKALAGIHCSTWLTTSGTIDPTSVPALNLITPMDFSEPI